MKKRIAMAALALVLCAGVLLVGNPMRTKAASGVAYNSKIKSHGTLYIKEGGGDREIKIYASDLHYLQNELDALMSELP